MRAGRLSLLVAVASLVVLCTAGQALAVSVNFVVSQVYGGGGTTGATYTHDSSRSPTEGFQSQIRSSTEPRHPTVGEYPHVAVSGSCGSAMELPEPPSPDTARLPGARDDSKFSLSCH